MKVVLLAAGRSFRMAPIADKNFLKFLGRPLIAHQIEALLSTGFREILVVGGRHNLAALRRVCASVSNGKISVREQKDLELGMAGAVLVAASWIEKEPFLLVSGNDVLEEEAFSVIASHAKGVAKQSSQQHGLLLARKVDSYFPGGYLKTNPRGFIEKIVEKPEPGREPSKLVNIVAHFHPNPQALLSVIASACLPYKQAAKQSRKGDDMYERALQQLFDKKIPYRALPYGSFWQPVKYPWHVLALAQHFLGRAGSNTKKAEIAKTATIKGDVYLEEGVRVMDNAVIQGPAYIGKNSVIATNALVRESHIGADCVIGFGSEIARSYVGDKVWTHTNYIGDSVIGNDVSFGAGTVTGNLRLDGQPVRAMVSKTWGGKEEKTRVDTGLGKLGLITGDRVGVGINTSFMPGVKVGANSYIGAGIVIGEDVPEGSFVRGEWRLKVSRNKMIHHS